MGHVTFAEVLDTATNGSHHITNRPSCSDGKCSPKDCPCDPQGMEQCCQDLDCIRTDGGFQCAYASTHVTQQQYLCIPIGVSCKPGASGRDSCCRDSSGVQAS